MSNIELLFERRLERQPDVSLVLLDWCVRESFHSLDYFAQQTTARDRYEIIWIEYYDRAAPEIYEKLNASRESGAAPVVDKWLRMNMPREAYYHKHLMYNLGIALAEGRIVTICDSDAMVRDSFVESIIRSFDEDPKQVLHLDEVRNVERRFYPFNYPRIDDLTAGQCINWSDGQTTGLQDQDDPLHTRNSGACFCAVREDLIAIGGADEHLDYLGHICGPYELTWRLVNSGRTERWHPHEFLYHTWHPGTDGDQNYLGPHDGRNLSTTALKARRTRRVMPFVENPLLQSLRLRRPLPPDRARWLDLLVDETRLASWRIDETKQAISAGRAAFAQQKFDEAITCWERVVKSAELDSMFWSDLGWAYYYRERYADANRAFNLGLDLDAGNSSVLRGRAWTGRQLKRFDAATEDFTRALDLIDADDRQARQESYRGRAWCWFHRGHVECAIDDFAKAIEHTGAATRGTLEDVYRGLGWSNLRSGVPAAADEWFAKALDAMGPENISSRQDAVNGRAAARRALGRPGISPAVPASPHLPASPALLASQSQLLSELVSQLGWALNRNGLHVEALARFDEALARDPVNPRAASGRGWSLLHLHRHDKAIEQFTELLNRLGPDDGDLMQEAARGRAWAFYRAGRLEEAMDDFSTALKNTDPGDRRAQENIFRGRSRVLFRLGRRREAMSDAASRHNQPSAGSASLITDVYGSLVKNSLQRLFARH